MKNYNGRLIFNGEVEKQQSKEFTSEHEAYVDAHKDIDPFSGYWVEITPAPDEVITNGSGDKK